MKVLLMHPDQDFDPNQAPPPNAEDLKQDLELNTLFETMAQGDKVVLKVVQQAILNGLKDPQAVRYRQEILQDCLEHPEVIRQLYQIPIKSLENKQKQWLGVFTRYPSGILSSAREMLVMLVALLKELRAIADEHGAEFKSPGFRRFFAMVQEELDDGYFEVVAEHLKTLQFRSGVLVSAELGRGNEGVNYLLRKANHTKRGWIAQLIELRSPVYSYSLHPRDEAGARALGDLRDEGVNFVANATAQSADHIDSFFQVLRLELAFYIGCLNLSEQISSLGEPTAIPEIFPAGERRLAFCGLYDISLALTMKQPVVGNDVHAQGKDLVVVTGANQGGKSTFLRSIGLAQLMAQAGMFAPAQSFTTDLCQGVFTHYKREEDAAMESGKLDEELGRMSAIVDNLRPNSMVLFNESFAATNEREGSEIARQITSALLEQGVKVFYVTHLYEFASGFYEKQMENALFLRAERKTDGVRTFRLIEGEPLQTSFGMDVYRQVFERV